MKTRIILFVLIGIAISVQAAQSWRVTTDKSLKPHYSNLQHAIDSCGVGDTIYLYPGNYGSVTVAKKLTIFGVGYFLAEHSKDSINSFVGTSHLDNITFNAGSDFSLISGLDVGGGINCNNVNSISIIGNRYGGISLTNSNYTIIKKNYGGGNINESNSSNILIANNILVGINFYDSKSSCVAFNNYFGGRLILYNSIVYNNLDKYDPYYDMYPDQFINCNLYNNMSGYISNFGNTNGNCQSDFNSIYPNGVTADNYQLPANSTAKGRGVGGTDIGPFGGDDPYSPGGLNLIPSINVFTTPVYAKNNGLNIRVVVQSHK